jgi:hypothetical protein
MISQIANSIVVDTPKYAAVYYILIGLLSILTLNEGLLKQNLSIIWNISLIFLTLIIISLAYNFYFSVGFLKEQMGILFIAFLIYTLAYLNFYFINDVNTGNLLWVISNTLLLIFTLRFFMFMANFNENFIKGFNRSFPYFAIFMLISLTAFRFYDLMPFENIASSFVSFTIVYLIFLTFRHHEKLIYFLIFVVLLNSINDIAFYFFYEKGIVFAAVIDTVYMFVYAAFFGVFAYLALKIATVEKIRGFVR